MRKDKGKRLKDPFGNQLSAMSYELSAGAESLGPNAVSLRSSLYHLANWRSFTLPKKRSFTPV